MRAIAILLLSMLTACAGGGPITPPAVPLKAQRSPSDFTCPDWPIAEILAAAAIDDEIARSREMIAVIAELGEPAARTCLCKLKILGAREFELGRVSGRVTVPPMCKDPGASLDRSG